jgi:HSP20 family protein
MSTLHQLRDGLSEAWDTFMHGWERLYRRAEGAITRYTAGAKSGKETSKGEHQEIAARSAGWGVLAAEVFDDEDDVMCVWRPRGWIRTIST